MKMIHLFKAVPFMQVRTICSLEASSGGMLTESSAEGSHFIFQ